MEPKITMKGKLDINLKKGFIGPTKYSPNIDY